MFSSLSEFLQVWKRESQATLRVVEGLTNESLGQAVTDEDRTLGRIAWHIVTTIPEMMSKIGLVFTCVQADAPVPKTAAEIADRYRDASAAMVDAIKSQWNDGTLAEERDIYGERWTIEATLNALISHEIHHRGQMTILMRQAGLKVPGVYGPSREEWKEYGMEAPVI